MLHLPHGENAQAMRTSRVVDRGEQMADVNEGGSRSGEPAFDPMRDVGLAPDAPAESSGSDSFTEATSRSWLQRLMGAVAGVVIGLVLVLAMCAMLFWNEGRAVQTARSLAEGSGTVVGVESARVDAANDGRLVHVQGDLATASPLFDPDLLVQAQAARLVRSVAMYQWKEEKHTRTEKQLGGGEETFTTYSYSKTWSDRRIESGSFRQPGGHQNPQMRYAKFETAARDASLGAFRPGPAVLQHLAAEEALRVDSAVAEKLRGRTGQLPAQVVDGALYLGRNPDAPQIGDLRISYQIAPVGPVSLVGRQAGMDLGEFQTKAGDRLLMASHGLVPAADMFRQAEQENMILTWILRVVGLVFLWVAWFLILRPIAVVGDVVPLIGSVLAAGAGIASLVLAMILGPFVMAAAWFFYRPLIAVALMGLSAAVVALLTLLGRRRQAGRVSSDPTRGQTAPA
jgi:hypothetical protein